MNFTKKGDIMVKYIIKRILISLLILLGVLTMAAWFLFERKAEVASPDGKTESVPLLNAETLELFDSAKAATSPEYREKFIKELEEKQQQFYREQFRASIEKSTGPHGNAGEGEHDAWIQETVEEGMRRSEKMRMDAVERFAESVL